LYTKTRILDKIEDELESALENYYTAEVCDEKFAPIGSGGGGSVDLSNYYTKAETYSQSEVDEALGDYYTKTETDSALENSYTAEECDDKIEDELGSALENYYTAEECDDKIEDELESALENYYTAEECDDKFALIGSGGGESGGGGVVPENKGELVIGGGSGAALLTAGQNQQLLVANPNATLGADGITVISIIKSRPVQAQALIAFITILSLVMAVFIILFIKMPVQK
jgi:hypothetical protein